MKPKQIRTSKKIDRYQLQDPIDRNDISTAYYALSLRTGRVVSIRILRDFYGNDPKFMARFQRKQHPSIVQVYDYGQADSKYYFFMELVEGTDLWRCLCGPIKEL
jgi:eukaryotic-like serine/threonine-protein kinase